MRVRVSAVRSAWVRRRAVAQRTARGFLRERNAIGTVHSRPRSEPFVDDRDGISLQRNLAGHAGRLAGGHIEGAEVEGALHGLAVMMPSSDSEASPWVHMSAVA